MVIKRIKIVILTLLVIVVTQAGLVAFEQVGMASWYGPNFHGKLTANGEIFNTYAMTAAHKTLPLGSIVKVISLENKRSIVVRINDRGPYAKGRIIDLSKKAAAELNMLKKGTMKVKVILIKKGDNKYYRYGRHAGKLYYIQVASLTTLDSAMQLGRRVVKSGVKAKILKVRVKGKIYYRVVTAKANYHDLQKQKTKLHSVGINSYLIKQAKR